MTSPDDKPVWDELAMRARYRADVARAEHRQRECRGKIRDGRDKGFYESDHDFSAVEWKIADYLGNNDVLRSPETMTSALDDIERSTAIPFGVYDRATFGITLKEELEKIRSGMKKHFQR